MIYLGTVKHGVVELQQGAVLPDGTLVTVEAVPPQQGEAPKRPGTSLADWAENNAEDWGPLLNSADVESFTGRRF